MQDNNSDDMHQTILHDLIKQPNIEISLKNKDTLQQYQTQAHLDTDYLPKLQKWISKHKYAVDELFNDCTLTVCNVFTF